MVQVRSTLWVVVTNAPSCPGCVGMHAEIREAVSKLINVSELRHISFSHFESDECGSLNEWLAVAPKADVI